MAAKQSNPAATGLIMLSIVIVLVLVFLSLMLFTGISVYRIAAQDEDDPDVDSAWEAFEDATLSICGICIFWPITLLYVATAFSISLRGRDVYGKKHAVSTIIGFFLGIGGVVMALAGSFLFLILLGGEVGMPISITLPVAMISVGLFLFIKDIGGKIFGSIGMGLVCLSQLGLMIALIMVFGSDTLADTKGGLIISIISLLFSMIGMIVLAVGYVVSFMWTGKNKPLIDEEQAQQLQMQQQQLSLQQEQLSIQKQQLQLQMQQTGYIEEKNKEQIPPRTGGGQGA